MKAIERDSMKYLGLDRAQARQLERITSEHGPICIAHAMKLIDELIDGYGVESILNHRNSSVYPEIVCDYVNTGDTYNSTVVYRHDIGKFQVTDWGTVVERYERRHGRIVDCTGH